MSEQGILDYLALWLLAQGVLPGLSAVATSGAGQVRWSSMCILRYLVQVRLTLNLNIMSSFVPTCFIPQPVLLTWFDVYRRLSARTWPLSRPAQ